jgi:hypothetical protein
MKELSEASLEETIRKINEMVKDGEKLINLQPTQVWFPFQPTEEQLASARVLLKDVDDNQSFWTKEDVEFQQARRESADYPRCWTKEDVK